MEFAKAKHDEGMGIKRPPWSRPASFRPILMTTFFILGVVPLMRAKGGCSSQNVMGTAVFSRHARGHVLRVFLIPGNFAFVLSVGRGKEKGTQKRRHWSRKPIGSGALNGPAFRCAAAWCCLFPWVAVGPDYEQPPVVTPPSWRRRRRTSIATFPGGSCSRTNSFER